MLEKRVAATTLMMTFFLLILGAIVHNTGSSLACPDWPLCFGEIFPEMTGGIAIEHGHRLMAAFVGLLTLFMTFLFYFRRPQNRQLQRLSLAALGLVILQGILGGLTVIYKLPTLISTAHLAISMLFFCLLIVIYFHARRSFAQPDRVSFRLSAKGTPSSLSWTGIAIVLVYCQILLGALVRHTGSGAACGLGPGTWFLCFDGFFTLWPASLPAQLHMAHRLFAILTAMSVFICSYLGFHKGRQTATSSLTSLSLIISLLVILQIVLGIVSVSTYLNLFWLTAHLAVAASLLVSLVSLFLTMKYRLMERDPSASPQDDLNKECAFVTQN